VLANNIYNLSKLNQDDDELLPDRIMFFHEYLQES